MKKTKKMWIVVAVLSLTLSLILLGGEAFGWIVFGTKSPAYTLTTTDGYPLIFQQSLYHLDTQTWEWKEPRVKEIAGESDALALDFGVIDNVAQLYDYNYVYYRLRVPKGAGTNVSVRLAYAAPANGLPYTFWYKDSTDNMFKSITDTAKLDAIGTIENPPADSGKEAIPFLSYQALWADVPPDGELDPTTLDFSTAATHGMPEGQPMGFTHDDSKDAYLVIKITPSLEAMVEIIDVIYEEMPFTVDFALRFEATVY